MKSGFLPAARLAVLGLVLTLALVGCGRRGALEPPPGGKTLPGDEAAATAPGEPKPDRFGGKPRQPIQRPKQPFVLDPLL